MKLYCYFFLNQIRSNCASLVDTIVKSLQNNRLVLVNFKKRRFSSSKKAFAVSSACADVTFRCKWSAEMLDVRLLGCDVVLRTHIIHAEAIDWHEINLRELAQAKEESVSDDTDRVHGEVYRAQVGAVWEQVGVEGSQTIPHEVDLKQAGPRWQVAGTETLQSCTHPR